MRIIIFGAGAIGTYVGCSLINAGAEVVFFDRPETCRLIQEYGLHVAHKNNAISVEIPTCISSIKEVEKLAPFNLGIVAVKSFDTSELIQQLEPLTGILPPLLSLQNGVENEPLVQTLIGEDNTIYGSVTTAIHRKQTGEVVVERLRGIGLAGKSPNLPDIVRLFNKAGLNARQFPVGQALSMKWSKMLTNLLTNAQAAILQLRPSEILVNPGLFHIEAKQFVEATQVMNKLGLHVLNLPGTQVKLMTWLFIKAPEFIARPVLELGCRKRTGRQTAIFVNRYPGETKTK